MHLTQSALGQTPSAAGLTPPADVLLKLGKQPLTASVPAPHLIRLSFFFS